MLRYFLTLFSRLLRTPCPSQCPPREFLFYRKTPLTRIGVELPCGCGQTRLVERQRGWILTGLGSLKEAARGAHRAARADESEHFRATSRIEISGKAHGG